MALIFNGKSISAGTNVTFRGTALQKIYYGNTLVWQKYSDVTNASIYAWTNVTMNDGNNIYPYSPRAFGNYSRSTIAANSCIAWNGNYANVKANVACTVTITGTLTCSALDSSWVYAYFAILKNNSLHTVPINATINGKNIKQTINVTVNLAAGESLAVSYHGGGTDGNSHRAEIYGTIYFSAKAF